MTGMPDKTRWVLNGTFIVATVLVVLSWSLLVHFRLNGHNHLFDIFNEESMAAFSNLGVLFSGLAFVGFLYSLALQRAEFRDNRQEMIKANEESRANVKAQRLQVEAMKLTAMIQFQTYNVQATNNKIADLIEANEKLRDEIHKIRNNGKISAMDIEDKVEAVSVQMNQNEAKIKSLQATEENTRLEIQEMVRILSDTEA
jgi:hypothetical protein